MPQRIRITPSGNRRIKLTESGSGKLRIKKRGSNKVTAGGHGSKKIKLKEQDFSTHVDRFKGSWQDFGSIKPNLPHHTSKSAAMDEYARRMEELERCVKEYCLLLEGNVKAMQKAARKLKDTDRSIGASMGGGGGGSR